ncbi:hypothetical protein CDAR_229591 [Caerostris darwini]|uniref:Uncharacterized protein n=1 Tax=Caerostris darwini TaxID=1538125 RepID=A0AAV4Q0N7_9ARAC|nr:hypothetical protein CDAR_229591 [Caerostris darwini]
MALLRPLLHGARYGNRCLHTALVTDIRCSNIDHAECERPNPRDDSQELPASLPSSLDCLFTNTDTTEDAFKAHAWISFRSQHALACGLSYATIPDWIRVIIVGVNKVNDWKTVF